MNHTQGPWIARKNSSGIAFVYPAGATGIGSAICGVVQFPPNGDAEANAKLIVAAPDLLQSVELLVKRLEKWPGSENPEFFPELKAARNLLINTCSTNPVAV